MALATCAALPDLDEDGPALRAALAAAGIDGVPAVWDRADVDWAAFALVVVRSTWDYTRRREQYLEWADSVDRLANPAGVLRWNTDKTYLRDLEAAGVPVVPTTWLVPGQEWSAPPGEYVVKPAIGAGARDAARYGAGEDASAHATGLLGRGDTVMVQPYLSGVDLLGETSLLFFAGALSHAARKAAILGRGAGVVDIDSRSFVSPATATREQVEVAVAALDAVPGGAPLLYARVDLVPGDDGTPLVLELELTEPSLFLGHSRGAPERFAAAVAAAVATH